MGWFRRRVENALPELRAAREERERLERDKAQDKTDAPRRQRLRQLEERSRDPSLTPEEQFQAIQEFQVELRAGAGEVDQEILKRRVEERRRERDVD